MKVGPVARVFTVMAFVGVVVTSLSAQGQSENDRRDERRREDSLKDGQRLFERETFGGNGRTCLTCHSRKTGTVSPQDAQNDFRPTLGIRYSFTTAATMGTATA
jgi:hypothetical protein